MFGEQLSDKIKWVYETQKISQTMANNRFDTYNAIMRYKNKVSFNRATPFWKIRAGGHTNANHTTITITTTATTTTKGEKNNQIGNRLHGKSDPI